MDIIYLSCECGWRPTPGAVIRCDVVGRGPYYCPNCSKAMTVLECNSAPNPPIKSDNGKRGQIHT